MCCGAFLQSSRVSQQLPRTAAAGPVTALITSRNVSQTTRNALHTTRNASHTTRNALRTTRNARIWELQGALSIVTALLQTIHHGVTRDAHD